MEKDRKKRAGKDAVQNNQNVSNAPYYPALPTLEITVYILLYTTVILGTISNLFYSSKKSESKYLRSKRLGLGWNHLIGRHIDTSDFEWTFWKRYIWEVVVLGFIGHFIVARLADAYMPLHRFKVYLLYSIAFTVYFLGLSGLLFMLSHFLIQYTVAVLSKNVAVCWLSGCILAFTLMHDSCVSYVKVLYPNDESLAYFLLYSTAMCNIRYIGFSLEYVWSLQTFRSNDNINFRSDKISAKDTDDNLNHGKSDADNANVQKKNLHTKIITNISLYAFLDLLVYQMYYPVFYGGPIITYNEFARQFSRAPLLWTADKTKSFIVGMARFIFWHLATDFLLHFFYVSSISSDYALLQDLPLYDLFGVALACVMFFCLKYVCMYGLPAHFATSDNMDIPGAPHCVFAKHRMTDMWKYFDKGLHSWLIRYIYVPCGGSRVNLFRSTLNSVLPFAFVCFWHGASNDQMYWAVLSWVGVYLEACAFKFYKTDKVKYHEERYFTPAWSRRVRAVLSAPLLFLLLTSNLYFLCGVRVGNLFWRRLYYENFFSTLLMLVFFYAGCQTSMEISRFAQL